MSCDAAAEGYLLSLEDPLRAILRCSNGDERRRENEGSGFDAHLLVLLSTSVAGSDGCGESLASGPDRVLGRRRARGVAAVRAEDAPVAHAAEVEARVVVLGRKVVDEGRRRRTGSKDRNLSLATEVIRQSSARRKRSTTNSRLPPNTSPAPGGRAMEDLENSCAAFAACSTATVPFDDLTGSPTRNFFSTSAEVKGRTGGEVERTWSPFQPCAQFGAGVGCWGALGRSSQAYDDRQRAMNFRGRHLRLHER